MDGPVYITVKRQNNAVKSVNFSEIVLGFPSIRAKIFKNVHIFSGYITLYVV